MRYAFALGWLLCIYDVGASWWGHAPVTFVTAAAFTALGLDRILRLARG